MIQPDKALTTEPDRMPRQVDPTAERRSRGLAKGLARRIVPVAVVCAGLAFAYAMGWHEYFDFDTFMEHRQQLADYVQGNLLQASLTYVVIYIVAVAFSFPGASLLTIAGGFVFGWLLAGILTAIAAPVGASIIYLVAKSAVGDFLVEKMKRSAGSRIRQLAEGFREDAFSYLLVIRLAPIFPFWVINIAPAIFNVPLGTYFAATAIGILPGTFAYAFLGEGIDSVVEAHQAAGTELSVGDLVTPEITAAFLALAVVAMIPPVIRKLRARRS